VVALVLGPGLQRRQVGAGAWLGVALAPPHLAAHDARHVLLLLLLGAVLEQGRAEHRDAHAADRITRADPGHFLLKEAGLIARQAAAVGFRPRRRAPAFVAHALAPELGVWGLG